MTFTDYIVFGLVIAFLLYVAAFFINGYKQALAAGQRIQPLTPDDRLRISLARRLLEDAERELAKAITQTQPDGPDYMFGRPQVHELLGAVQQAATRARQLLRES